MSKIYSNFAPVIELNRHIEILLLNNDCVIVPNLGGFMAHHVEARYEEDEQAFLPPLRTLGLTLSLRLTIHFWPSRISRLTISAIQRPSSVSTTK